MTKNEIMAFEQLQFDEARGRRAFALLDVEGKGLELKDIGKALESAGLRAPLTEQHLTVEEFLACRKRTGALEFAEFLHLYDVVIKSENRRLRWQFRMQEFLSNENLTRMAQRTFSRCADSSDGVDQYAPAERFEDIVDGMGLMLESSQRTELLDAVCAEGRIAQAKFLEALNLLWEKSPATREAHSALLRRRQLEERSEIESVFALYDYDECGSIEQADLTAALTTCGWDESQVESLVSQLKSRDTAGGLGAGTGAKQEGGVDGMEGKRRVTLDEFVECLLATSAYKHNFFT